MHLEQFVNDIKSTYGDNLKSVVLFGSAAANDFSKKYSDYNTIVVLNKTTPTEIKKARKTVRQWTKKGNPTPLFFDKNHIDTSTDVFPIEFYDIKESRRVLYGDDPFTEIKINTKNLRHQCESELKGKILQLQSRFIDIANCEKKIAKLMMESLSTFLSVFKGVVRLLGHDPEKKKRELVEQLSTMINFSPNIFMDLLDIRDGKALLPRRGVLEKFEDYLEQLQIIADFVDGYGI